METGPSVAQTDNGRELIYNCHICKSLVMKPSTEFFQVTYWLLRINNSNKNQHMFLKKFPMLEAINLKSQQECEKGRDVSVLNVSSHMANMSDSVYLRIARCRKHRNVNPFCYKPIYDQPCGLVVRTSDY
jgi:hypothetical protein